jgi:hypothetical protein
VLLAASAAEHKLTILPQAFAVRLSTPQTSTNARSADPTNAPVLHEYRFTDFESANYTRDDGRTLKIGRALADASRPSAPTFPSYPQMNMSRSRSGASSGDRVLSIAAMCDRRNNSVKLRCLDQLRELAELCRVPAEAREPAVLHPIPAESSLHR